jgi:hypothetical protein
MTHEELATFIQEPQFLLLTTKDWFLAPDGKRYINVWGKAQLVKAKDAFGFEPRNSANWFWMVGEGPHPMFIMGCRVDYIFSCPNRPVGGEIWIQDADHFLPKAVVK